MLKIKDTNLASKLPISERAIERRIYTIRDQKVMLDKDLAELYQVPTKRLNEAVKRNPERFPPEFMFQLNNKEASNLRSQIATSKNSGMRSQIATASKRNKRYQPFAFTEYGIIMLSSVLNSYKAIQMNIVVVRAFVNLRFMIEDYKNLAKEVIKIKGTQDLHTQVLLKVIKNLKKISTPPSTSLIGFKMK